MRRCVSQPRGNAVTTAVRLALGTVVALGCSVLLFYEIYVPGAISEVAGIAVIPETVASRGDAPRYYVYVRLDRGATVRARVDPFVSVMPGQRVIMEQVETPLFGVHWYRVQTARGC